MSEYDHLYNFGVESTAEYFKITNLSPVPILRTWVKALLDDEDLELYEQFKESADFKGYTPVDIAAKKAIPEAIKIRPFYDQLGKGVRFKVLDQVQTGQTVSSTPRYEYRFCIGANIDVIRKQGQNAIGVARWICSTNGVLYTAEDDLESLLKRIEKQFGSNVVALNRRQWKESGLQDLEFKQKAMELKPGQTKAKMITLGLLKAEPLQFEEYQMFKEGGQELVPSTEALPDDSAEITRVREEAEKAEEKVQTTIEDMTIPELKAELDERGVEYKEKSPKPVLVNLLKAEVADEV